MTVIKIGKMKQSEIERLDREADEWWNSRYPPLKLGPIVKTAMKNMKIGYARVSRDDQNLDLQTDALTAAGAERTFTDKASGAQFDRPGLREMLSHVRKGDTVIVWRLDRLARSLKDLMEIATDLERSGTNLILLNEGIDTTTTSGKLFFQIFGALAEFERNLIRERTNAGLAAARSRGRLGGRKPVLTDEKKAAIDAMAKGRPAASIRSIANAVGVSERTIRRYLQ